MRSTTSLQLAVSHANADVSTTKSSQIEQPAGPNLSSSVQLRHQYTLTKGRRLSTALTARMWRVFKVLLPVIAISAATPAWSQSENNLAKATDGSRCSDSNVEIDSHLPEDRKTACAGAIVAKDFLSASGINTQGRIKISMVSEFTDASHNAFGYFDRASERIYVLNFEAARRAAEGVGVYGEPMDRDLHRSIVVHEVAHLLANRNFSKDEPQVAAHEYIAYVSQFATMPLPIRNRILGNNPGEGFQANWQINSFDLKFAPNQFGVRAYQHFIRPENGPAFLRGVLSGKIQVGIPLPL